MLDAKTIQLLADRLDRAQTHAEAERGQHLPASSFVMTGGITEAIAVEAGDLICARYLELGSISMRFV